MNLTMTTTVCLRAATRNTLGQSGTTFATSVNFTVADFNPSTTTPDEFKSLYEHTFAAGTNDNASFAFTGAPPIVSNTDLHSGWNGDTAESRGTGVSVGFDIDGRPVMRPRRTSAPTICGCVCYRFPPAVTDLHAVR